MAHAGVWGESMVGGRRGQGGFGTRILRRGHTGEDVADLQKALARLGYDVGPVDGYYGYLTSEAVRAFQREHRLRVDGIAGKQVWGLLRDESLAQVRQVHHVKAGETLSDIADRHGLTTRALRHINRLRPRQRLYPGQQLLIRSRYILAYFPPEPPGGVAAQTVMKAQSCLSGVAAAHYRVTADGDITIARSDEALWSYLRQRGIETWLTVCNWNPSGEPDLEALRSTLRKRGRERFVERVVALASAEPFAGVHLDLTGLGWGDGTAFTHLVVALRRAIEQRGRRLRLLVSVPLPRSHPVLGLWLNDVPLDVLARNAWRLIITTHHTPGPSGGVPAAVHAGAPLTQLVRRVPAHKLLLGVPIWATERQPDAQWRRMPYQQALTGAYLRRVRPTWVTATRQLHYRYETEAGPGEVWLENQYSLLGWLELIDRYNLFGAALWQVGGEDRRIWDQIPLRLKAFRGLRPV